MNCTYKGLRSYVSWMLKKTMFKSFNSMGLENVPAPGTPVLVVENHQNGICDPLGLVVSLQDRKTLVFSRADIFHKNKYVSRFLSNIGLLPAYRMDHEGIEEVEKNYQSFDKAEQMLLKGETVAIYPEGKHQGKRILGHFSSAYLRMAFEAAKEGNFEKEIWILPTCNHYSSYSGLRNQAMIRYGVPIALSQWYEQYKEKPRTTCSEVNKLVRGRIEEMMLNIPDEEEYGNINFLCNTMNHYKHAQMKNCLPAMLEADKGLCHAIAQMDDSERDSLLKETGELRAMEDEMKINDESVECDYNGGLILGKSILATLLLPLWIVSLWPGIVAWLTCKLAAKKCEDPIHHNAILIAVGGMIVMPIMTVATIVVLWIFCNWWIALIWGLISPVLTRFAWTYSQRVQTLLNIMRVNKKKNTSRYNEMMKIRNKIKTIIEEL